MSQRKPQGSPLDQGRSARGFMEVWLPSVIAIIGSGACLFAISWWLSTTPQGGAALGTVVGVSAVISLSLNALLSSFVDTGNRRKIASVLLLMIILAFPGLYLLLGRDLNVMIGIVCSGVLYAWISTSETVYLGLCETTGADLAPSSWPKTRIALLTQIHSQVDRIIAPLFAGLLIGSGMSRTVPLISAALVMVALVSIIRYRTRYETLNRAQIPATTLAVGESRRRPISQISATFTLIRKSPSLTYMVVFGVLGNLAVFPFYAILAAYLTIYIPAGTESAVWYSWCSAAYGVGMLVGSTILLSIKYRFYDQRGMLFATVALALICTVIIGITLVDKAHFVVLGLGIVGLLFSFLTAVGGAIWLKETPSENRARVFSLRRLMVYSSIPIGTLAMGFGGMLLGYAEFTRWVMGFVLLCLTCSWIVFTRRRHGLE